MKKLFLLSCLLALPLVEANADSAAIVVDQKGKTTCCDPITRCDPNCPPGPRGHKGKRGKRGPTGSRGERGETTPFGIFDVLEATSTTTGPIAQNSFIPFDPIIDGQTGLIGIPIGGISLLNPTTISLPIEPVDTIYSVSYGVSTGFVDIALIGEGDFQLVLNGQQLPYTTLSIAGNNEQAMFTKTSVIVNPANTQGTLGLLSIDAGTSLGDRKSVV